MGPHRKNSSFKKRKNVNKEYSSEYRHQDQLSEEDVGIRAYMSKLEGYSAVIKARFSDFHVNEINRAGKMAKLTDMSEPKVISEINSPKFSYTDTPFSPFLEKISQKCWEDLKELVTSSEILEPVNIDANEFSKEEREKVHQCVKNYFGQSIVASTITRDDKTVMEFKKFNKQFNNNQRMNHWPKELNEFVYFIVYKEKMDTMNACIQIAQSLKMNVSKITYAGVKDKRGKTSQWFCVRKRFPEDILKKTKFIRNLKVGNFEFNKDGLKLGQLTGNRFRVALRNVLANDELINNSIEHLKKHGIINYYGLQRFGNDKEAPTYLIGIKLLQGAWQEAIDLILRVKSSDNPTEPINLAKKCFSETHDASEALKLCNRAKNTVEKKLLEGLVKHHKSDLVNSLESIPRSMRLMYIHSFQSFIWNHMASKRIEKFGLELVKGDLILNDEKSLNAELLEESEDSREEDAEKAETVEENKKKLLVRALKDEELTKYSIYDIVLPLPGYDVIYPENLLNEYKEIIEKYGLSLEMPKQKVRTYNLSGTYRKLFQKPSNIEYKIIYYNNPTDNLIRSDFEELKGDEEPQSVEGGKYKAIVLNFTLNSASYATMVLREILKCNTSSSFQANLNNYERTTEGTTILNNYEELLETAECSIDQVQEGSLLNDKEKYEDFKKKVFEDILLENSSSSIEKRKQMEEPEAADEELNLNKKIKIDE